MFKKISLTLLLFFLLIILASCSSEEADPIPWDRLVIEEKDLGYAGYYFITRQNLGQQWEEDGEWTSFEVVFKNTIVCFGSFPKPLKAYFTAHPDYQWVEVYYQGRNCLELVKK